MGRPSWTSRVASRLFASAALVGCGAALPPASPDASNPRAAAAASPASGATADSDEPRSTSTSATAGATVAALLAEITMGSADELTVRVYAHAIATRSGIVPVWVFVSDGLARHGQEEVVIAIRRGVGEQANYPRDVLTLYNTLLVLAADNRLVFAGEQSILGPDVHLLGVPELRGILYAPGQRIAGVPLPESFLTALFTTEEEHRLVGEYGEVRFLAHLGAESGVHPFPPWTDASRTPITRASMSLSLLATPVPRLASAGLVVALETPPDAQEVRLEGRVVLRVAPEALGALDDMLASLADNMPVALLADFDPGADAVFTYKPGSPAPTALSCDESRATQLLADFLVIVPGHGTGESLTMKEDGFVLQISAATWATIREAMATRAPFSAQFAGFEFAMEWPSARPREPFDSWCAPRRE